MSTYFAYQDSHGFIYPAHPVLLRKPGLVPGEYDPVSRVFTPTGNPLKKTGNIIEDVDKHGNTTVLSGLAEDTGAETAPINGVVFTEKEVPQTETEAELPETEKVEDFDLGKHGRKVPKK